jgi:hypothetical protein
MANATTLLASYTNQNATVPPGRIRGRQRDLTEQKHRLQPRQLRLCRNCGRYCAVLGFGCVVRRLEGSSDHDDAVTDMVAENPSRRRLTTTACDPNITAVTAALEQLRSPSLLLSNECQNLIFAPRNVSCVPTTTDCFVESFVL